MKRNFTSAMRVFRLFFNVFELNNSFEMKIFLHLLFKASFKLFNFCKPYSMALSSGGASPRLRLSQRTSLCKLAVRCCPSRGAY